VLQVDLHRADRLLAAIQAGEGHQFAPFGGQSAGLVADVRPAADLVRDTVRRAAELLGIAK
jgi:hypothetical protein